MQELGYKGFPILALHPPFHLVNGITTDYLHCVLLGVTKMLIEYWFQKNSRKAFYIGRKVQHELHIYVVLYLVLRSAVECLAQLHTNTAIE